MARAKRGDELRQHMLFVAKDVFLEAGFERASMDVIAERAETTKRTLYAHFESKDKLFVAVIDLVRGLVLGKLELPAAYAKDPEEALVLFCGRFLELMVWHRTLRMCRLTIAEVQRFPEGAVQLYAAIYETVQDRLEAFLRDRFALARKHAAHTASELLGRTLHPRFARALFGLDELTVEWLDDRRIDPGIDLKPIRRAVAELVTQPAA